MYNRSKIPRLQVMLQEAQENKKLYDEVELNEEIVRFKQKHFREQEAKTLAQFKRKEMEEN